MRASTFFSTTTGYGALQTSAARTLAPGKLLNENRALVMADLVLSNFPPSLLDRVDRYIELLEELNPGYKWTRSEAMASLLVRALAEVEGAALRNRRRIADRRVEPQSSDRREFPDERRSGVDRRKADLLGGYPGGAR
jgi:hypothetical protein